MSEWSVHNADVLAAAASVKKAGMLGNWAIWNLSCLQATSHIFSIVGTVGTRTGYLGG